MAVRTTWTAPSTSTTNPHANRLRDARAAHGDEWELRAHAVSVLLVEGESSRVVRAHVQEGRIGAGEQLVARRGEQAAREAAPCRVGVGAYRAELAKARETHALPRHREEAVSVHDAAIAT